MGPNDDKYRLGPQVCFSFMFFSLFQLIDVLLFFLGSYYAITMNRAPGQVTNDEWQAR